MNISKKKYDEMSKSIDDFAFDNVRLQRKLEESALEIIKLKEALRSRLLYEDSLMALNGLANAISSTIQKVCK